MHASPETMAAPPPDHGGDRRCLVTRRSMPRERMVRFVVGPDDGLVPDVAERLPGRGLWMAAERDIVAAADGKAVSRAARRRVIVPSDLAGTVEDLLARRCVETIALARRAGQAVSGFHTTARWLRDGVAAVLVMARDGAADGRRKLRGLAGGLPVADALGRTELGEAFGRDEVVHAALGPGALAGRLVRESARLNGFRGPADLPVEG